MTYGFRSIGTLGSSFNDVMTPGAPAGFQAGDLLVVDGFCVPGSITIPDLSSFGFVQLSLNSSISYAVQWGKIAVGSDTMPTFQMDADFQGCFCRAYTGAPSTIASILSRVGVERAVSSTNNVSFAAYSAPPDSGVLVLGTAVRTQGSASGVSFGSSGVFNTRGVWTTNARPHAIVVDLIQSSPATGSIVNVTMSPADSASETAGSELTFLKPGVASAIPYPPTSLGGMNVQVCQ